MYVHPPSCTSFHLSWDPIGPLGHIHATMKHDRLLSDVPTHCVVPSEPVFAQSPTTADAGKKLVSQRHCAESTQGCTMPLAFEIGKWLRRKNTSPQKLFLESRQRGTRCCPSIHDIHLPDDAGSNKIQFAEAKTQTLEVSSRSSTA